MALSPEDKAELRALIVEAVGAAGASLDRQIGDQIAGVIAHVDPHFSALRASLGLVHAKLDSIGAAVRDTRLQLTKLEKGPST